MPDGMAGLKTSRAEGKSKTGPERKNQVRT
jgi:hypothetical protein